MNLLLLRAQTAPAPDSPTCKATGRFSKLNP